MSGTLQHRDGAGRQGRRGQALIEMTVALVVIVVLFAALLQIGSLSRAHLATINEARGMAGMAAVSDTYQSISPSASLIAGWSEGDDGVRYSRDDQSIPAGTAAWRQQILPVAHPTELESRVPGNRISALMVKDPLAEELEFVRGHAQSRPVPLLPVVRHLLYSADSVRLESDSVTVWQRGLY